MELSWTTRIPKAQSRHPKLEENESGPKLPGRRTAEGGFPHMSIVNTEIKSPTLSQNPRQGWGNSSC
jgi:hypothetical protein